MRFLTSKETVTFLSQAAPRPWVQRMLCWMIIDGQLHAHFSKALIQATTNVFEFTLPFHEEAGEWVGPKMDAIIEREYGPDFARKLKAKDGLEDVYEDPLEWQAENHPEIFDSGFFLFASEIDWDVGTVKAEWLPDDRDITDMFFPSGELLISEFKRPDYSAFLEGLSFNKSRIEMMLPTIGMENTAVSTHQMAGPLGHVGRPKKWDWEGALANIIAKAQTPDGLPTGHGAQAKIETMIAEWFEAEVGSSPAVSQVRKRASAIVRMIQKA